MNFLDYAFLAIDAVVAAVLLYVALKRRAYARGVRDNLDVLCRLCKLVRRGEKNEAMLDEALDLLLSGGINIEFPRYRKFSVVINKWVECRGLNALLLSDYYLCKMHRMHLRSVRFHENYIVLFYDAPKEIGDYIELNPLKPQGALFLSLVDRQTHFLAKALSRVKNDEKRISDVIEQIKELVALFNVLSGNLNRGGD